MEYWNIGIWVNKQTKWNHEEWSIGNNDETRKKSYFVILNHALNQVQGLRFSESHKSLILLDAESSSA